MGQGIKWKIRNYEGEKSHDFEKLISEIGNKSFWQF
jgi:hypothetical protein